MNFLIMNSLSGCGHDWLRFPLQLFYNGPNFEYGLGQEMVL